MIEPATIGGIFLILGAYFLNKGDLLKSVFLYFIADCMWLVLALKQEDYFGIFTVSVGMIFGLIVWWKSNKGVFVKDLHKNR